MHGGEDITLKLPPSTSLRLLDSCLNSNPNALPTTDDTKKRFLHWIRLWWRQANQLRRLYLSHLSQYRDAMSYHSCPPGFNEYLVACYADCNGQLAERLDYLEAHGPHPEQNTDSTVEDSGEDAEESDQVADKLCPVSRSEEEESVSQERFYRAVMARFLDTKAWQSLAVIKDCDKSPLGEDLGEQIYNMWLGHDRTLLESLEILEIFDYTLNFLLYRVFNSPKDDLNFLQHRVFNPLENVDWEDEGPDAPVFTGPNETFLSAWYGHLVIAQTYLTPFDMLSIFMGGDEAKTKARPLLFYIDKPNDADAIGVTPGMRVIEEDVLSKLYKLSPEKWKGYKRQGDIEPWPAYVERYAEPWENSKAWELYRNYCWRVNVRGRVFADPPIVFADPKFDAIPYNMQDSGLWWERLKPCESDHKDAVSVQEEWSIKFGDLRRLHEKPNCSLQHYHVVDSAPG